MMEQQNTNEKKNFERINYAIRPAKHIERKLFLEAFTRLSILDQLNNFRYIGMGSAYFSDFSLFHKSLGIHKLVSIEGAEDNVSKKRIVFNKPFACIDMEFGWTTSILPKLNWDNWPEKSIVWLDYIDPLTEWMFGDIETVVLKAKPGSIILISVDIRPPEANDNLRNKKNFIEKNFLLSELETKVGKQRIPARVYDEDIFLNVDNNKSVIREIVHNSFLDTIMKRNNGMPKDNQIFYKQLFNLFYKDSTPMLTIGGIIYTKDQKYKVDEMFNNLHFIKPGKSCFDIIVPKLTFREIHALDKALPQIKGKKNTELNALPLSKEDKKNYANIYRYFPTFAETTL